MAARKKASRKKPAARRKPAPGKKVTATRKPRKLPDDEAWRELLETSVAKAASQSVSATPPARPRKTAKKK